MAEETNKKETKKKEANKFVAILKKIFLNPITISLFAMLLICICGFFYMQSWLGTYTNHGQEIEVPDLKGLSENDAAELLALRKIKCEVVDSTYASGTFRPGDIIEQVPKAGSHVKEGRKIYVTIQAREAKKVQLPDVTDGSARQAESTLKSIGINISNVEYVPSEFKDNVEEVRYHDKTIKPGYVLTVGSSVTLVVGRGLSNEETVVASLRGLRVESARTTAHEKNLNLGAIIFDKEVATDHQKENAFVYKQTPIVGKSVPLGTRVDIYLTLDRKKLEEPEEVFKDSTATPMAEGAEDGLWDN